MLVSQSNCELGFPGSSVVKNLPANARDTGVVCSIPGSSRSTGIGNSNPLQSSGEGNSDPLEYSSLENFMVIGYKFSPNAGIQTKASLA